MAKARKIKKPRYFSKNVILKTFHHIGRFNMSDKQCPFNSELQCKDCRLFMSEYINEECAIFLQIRLLQDVSTRLERMENNT